MTQRSSLFRLIVAAAVIAVVLAICGWLVLDATRAGNANGRVLLAGLVVVLTVIGARLFWLRWIVPAHELSEAIGRMNEGDWAQTLSPQAAEEMQMLAMQLNGLAQNVDRQLTDLRSERAALQALVDTLPDPILTTDDKDRIVLINLPASQLLDLPPERAWGTKLVAAVRDHALQELYDAAAHGPAHSAAAPVQREIRLLRNEGKLAFQSFAIRMNGGGVLLVLRDISQVAANIQMKTDFVANASHELRTPIAAIKIAFETLREVYADDHPQAERCIHIIEGHMKRLEEMLRDLLDLSRVESPELAPRIQPVKPSDVLAMLQSTLGPFARDQGVTLKFPQDCAASPPFYTSDRLLNLILRNLVENSIKYTAPGGSVEIEIVSEPQHVRLTVSDTGIGIAPEHVDRVFERFYQADPARSGSAGRGTGLGLAIVKHAVADLGGTIDLQSTEGVGTRVNVFLPRNARDETPHNAGSLE
jgi:signal transduction histidine kinase